MLLELVIASAAGLLVGALYFAGLWWAVRRLVHTRHATIGLFASTLVRLLLLLGALFWIMDGRWQRLLAAVAGVIVARAVATRAARAGVAPRNPVAGP
jgi:F1F0 ATPase subunit 2